MEKKDYAGLLNAIENSEKLESLYILGNALDRIHSDVSKTCIRGNLDFLPESISLQKAVYDRAVVLYECIEADDVPREDIVQALEALNEALRNYHAFARQ